MADFKLNVVLNGVEKTVSTINELEQALKATREELKGVAINSKEFEALGEQARILQREFVNSYKETTIFNKNIAELTESATKLGASITSAFTIATTAAKLLGSESKELTETQAKAQEALAIAISATTIATNAKTVSEDLNNVGLALQNGLTKTLTILLGQQTVASAAQAAATGTATIAQRALNAAMSANPILLVVTAVGALVAAYFALTDSEKKAEEKTKDVNEVLKENAKLLDESKKKNEDLRKQLNNTNQEALKSTGTLSDYSAEQSILLEDTFTKIEEIDKKFDESRTKLIADLKLTQDIIEQFSTGRLRANDTNYQAASQFSQLEIKLQQEAEKAKQLIFQIYQAQKEKLDADAAKKEKEMADKAAKDARESRKKSLDELREYNNDVRALDDERISRQLSLERRLQDFQLDRISLVAGLDGVFREDLIAGYDETIAKLQVARDRELADEKRSFDESLKKFKETESARVDANGKRLISNQVINAEISNRQSLFDDEQIKRAQTFNDQIFVVQQDRTNKIKEINEILNSELAFGDNNLYDSREKLQLDNLNFQIDLKKKELELEQSNLFDKRGIYSSDVENKKKSGVEILKEIQALQKAALAAERETALQRLKIDTEQGIKDVQGTEELKADQRLKIRESALVKEQLILAKFKQDEIDLEKRTGEEILKNRVGVLQELTDLVTNSSKTLLGSFNAFVELQKVETENYLRDLRDSTAVETSELNKLYNQQKADLDNRLKEGAISQQQYNETIKGLNANLAQSTKSLNDNLKSEETKRRKEQFENDKKLRIAQATIDGLQGAVAAFAGAMRLGPIAGPIVGSILAAAVATTTALNIEKIRKTQFDSGKPEVVAANTGAVSAGGAGAVNTGSSAINTSSAGGMTQFNQSLVGGRVAGVDTTGQTGPLHQRVYVVESDITTTQNRVRVLENNSTFG